MQDIERNGRAKGERKYKFLVSTPEEDLNRAAEVIQSIAEASKEDTVVWRPTPETFFVKFQWKDGTVRNEIEPEEIKEGRENTFKDRPTVGESEWVTLSDGRRHECKW